MATKPERFTQYAKEEAAQKVAQQIHSQGLNSTALNAVQATHANGTETCCQVLARLSGK